MCFRRCCEHCLCFGNVQPTEAVVNKQVLLASPATVTIFERSALLSNLQRGPSGASVKRASGLRPKATAHDFEHLSALALASEKVHSSSCTTIFAEHPDSGLLGRTDGTMLRGAPPFSFAGHALELPCGRICVTASQASAGSFQRPSVSDNIFASTSQFMPGWVPGAPSQRGQPEHHGVFPFTPLQRCP